MSPEFNPDTFETNVPGLFLAGGAICGRDTSNIFIENGRFHGETIIKTIASAPGQARCRRSLNRARWQRAEGIRRRFGRRRCAPKRSTSSRPRRRSSSSWPRIFSGPSFGAPDDRGRQSHGIAAVSETDSRRVARRAAHVSRAAGRAARSRAHARARPASGPTWRRSRPKGFRRSRRDPTQKIDYKWTSVRQDWATNYLGVPSDPSQPAWVLVILEPEPGAPADPAPNDETHHRLPDGTTLHVSIWNMPEEKRRSGFAALRLPQNEGWTNWLVGSMRNNDCCLDAEAQRREIQRRDAGTPGYAENTHFSAGCVSGLCGERRVCAGSGRLARNTTRIQDHDRAVLYRVCVSRETPSARTRRVARVSVLRFALVL